jgi:hypothetical protein
MPYKKGNFAIVMSEPTGTYRVRLASEQRAQLRASEDSWFEFGMK